MKYRVVHITNDILEYPDYEKETKEFSHLVKYVEDDFEIFVVAEDETFWEAKDFFSMTSIKKFEG